MGGESRGKLEPNWMGGGETAESPKVTENLTADYAEYAERGRRRVEA